MKKELSMAALPGWNADSKSTDLPQISALSARSTLHVLGIMILPSCMSMTIDIIMIV